MDVKLTLKPLADGPQAEQVMTRFLAYEGYRVLRLPIYAMRPVDDPIYDQGIEMRRLKVSLAVAAQIAIPGVVCEDKNNVWALGESSG